MKITVTQDHIVNGVRSGLSSCPVVLAIQEKKPNHKVSVDYGSVMMWPLSDYLDISFYLIPEEGKQFIKNFDNGEKVEPITLTLKKIRK